MQRLVNLRVRSREHPKRQRQPARPTLEALLGSVADCFEVSPESMKNKSRGHARKALAQIGLEDAGLTPASLAEWMGVSDWAVSKMRRAGWELYRNDLQYRARVDQLRRTLS
jgi:hypothetical protein